MPTPYDRYGLTKGTADQINRPGFVSAYKLGPDGKPIGGIPNMGETATAPAQPTESALDKATREYYESLNRTKPNEEQIRNDIRARMQGTIDAIDKEYQSLFAQENINAQDRLGQTRAINARSGLMGSDIGQANTAGTQMQNLRVRQALEAEKSQKIASVFTKIDADARAEIQAKKQEALGNAKAYIDYLAGAQTKARESVKTLAQGGVSLEDLAPEQYKKLLEKSGMDEFELKAFYNAAKPEGTKTTYKYEVKDGKIIAYGVNPTTGQLDMTSKDIPGGTLAANGEYKEQVMPDGTLLLIPDKIDPNKPLDQQIIRGGNYAKPEKPDKDTTKTGYKDASLNERAKAIAWVQTQEGFTTKDLEALKTDPDFFLFALGQAGLE